MTFIKDIAIPLIVCGIAVGLVSYVINVVLRLIRFDVAIIKIALFFVAWYFIGPIIYTFLVNNLIVYENEVISFIYTPVQTIMALFGI